MQSASALSSVRFLVFLPRAFVLQSDHPPRIRFIFYQIEFALRKAAGEKRDAFADENWDDTDVEFVYQIFFQEFANQFAAAHEPDMFAGALANFGNDGGGRIVRDHGAIAHA